MSSCDYTSIGDVPYPAIYLPLIPISLVFCITIYQLELSSQDQQSPSANRLERSSIAWLHLRTPQGARAWLVFYVLLAVAELWETYCIFRMMLDLSWGYWLWVIPNAPLWMRLWKHLGLLAFAAAFALLTLLCGTLCLFKVLAVSELNVWLDKTSKVAGDTAPSEDETKRC